MYGEQRDATPESDQPRWLTGAELDAWKKFSAMLVKLPAALDTQLQRDSDLNQFEYLVLAGLADAPDNTLQMSTLAILANGSLSRLSHVVKRLEKRGYLRREPCPEDGRYTNAVLTDAGRTKNRESAPGHVAQVRALLVDVLEPEQLLQLGEISLRVLRAMEPQLKTACGEAVS